MSKVCCYFCEDLYLYPDESFFIENYNGIWVCQENSNYCESFTIKDNIECPVCFENKKSVELNCKHEICIDCCKKIFIGTSEYKKPIHPKEITIEYPKWIFDIDEDDELFDEYSDFEGMYYDYEKYTFDENITIRNNLINERPSWMNTEDFINYENKYILYMIEHTKVENKWDEYQNSKVIGNCLCPLCRSPPPW